jgi:hypothetical protein
LVSGPVVTQPERSVRATASISASPMSGRASRKSWIHGRIGRQRLLDKRRQLSFH